MNEKNIKLLERNVIEAIKENNETALNKLYKHYEKFIIAYCTKMKFDENGKPYYFFDEDKYQEIKNGLFIAVKKFKI